MSWIRRKIRRLKNLSSDGDFAGSHGRGAGSAERDTRNANAQGQALANRPDRFDGGGGFSS